MIGKNLILLDILEHDGLVVGGLYANVEVMVSRTFETQEDVPTATQLLANLAYENTLLGDEINHCTPEILSEAVSHPNVHLGAQEDSITITSTIMFSTAQEPKNGISTSDNPAVTFYSGPQRIFGEAFAIAFPPEAIFRQAMEKHFGDLMIPEVLEKLIQAWMWDVRGIDLS